MRTALAGLAFFLFSIMPAVALTTLAGRVAESTVRVVVERKWHGAGVAISPRYILTALHVVANQQFLVIFKNGKAASAILVWASKKLDLALIDLGVTGNARVLPVACRAPRFMETVLVIGQGGWGGWNGSAGHVSRVQIKSYPGRFLISINNLPGFSGGPIVDMRGRLIGILVASSGSVQPPPKRQLRWPQHSHGIIYIGGFASAISTMAFCAEFRKVGYLPAKPRAGGVK